MFRITDERIGHVADCIDAPWQSDIELDNGDVATVTCKTFGNQLIDCRAELGEGAQIEFNGLSLLDSCCVCGGGLSPLNFPNTLVSWDLVLYGHEKMEDDASNVDGSANDTLNSNGTIFPSTENSSDQQLSNDTTSTASPTRAPISSSVSTTNPTTAKEPSSETSAASRQRVLFVLMFGLVGMDVVLNIYCCS